MSRDKMARHVRRILEEQVLRCSLPDDFDNRTPLRESLGLDSIQELDLLVGLEREFRFSLTDDDINPDLDPSVEHLVVFVEGKLS